MDTFRPSTSMLKPLLRRIGLAAWLVASTGTSALAHAVLLETDPVDGAVLATAPERATLRFNEPVTPVVVRVLGSDGKALMLPGVPKASDETVTVDLPPDLGAGGYVLSYRVISLDSHPIGGSLTFAVGAGNAPAPIPAANNIPRWDVLYAALRGFTLGMLFLALGGGLFRAFVLMPEARSTAAAARRIAQIAGPIAALAALLSVGVRGAHLAESPMAELFTAAPWRIALSTAMAPGLALVLTGLVVALLWPKPRVLAASALLLASIGLGLTSHAALAGPTALSFPAFVLHLGVAAFWFGSLPLLVLALAREPLVLAQAIVVRFSAFAVWGVAGLLVAGILLALVQTGLDLSVWMGPVWTYAGYGPLLTAKLVLVVLILILAIRNKRLLTPLLLRRKSEAPGLLRRSIAKEVTLMAVVIALAAALGSSVPPRSLAALQQMHDHHAVGAEGAVVDVVRDGVEILLEADPALPGPNELIVHFFDQAKGVHLAPTDVMVSAALPSNGIEPLRRAAIARGDGTYRIDAMPLPIAGVWEVRIEALITDFDKLIVTMELPIGAQEK